MHTGDYIIEACVEGVDQAVRAAQLGADRIELCARLDLDGLTPEKEVIRRVNEKIDIPVRVMIRPRPGDFNYTKAEIDEMKASIEICKEIGVAGVVLGVTTYNDSLDISTIAALSDHASPLKVTIHKAIDSVTDPVAEIEGLTKIDGIDSILTSGRKRTCLEGEKLIKALIASAGSSIDVIVCGSVTNQNIASVHDKFKARAYHGKLIVGSLDHVSTKT